jgi:predicted membrane-bound spermidine synthase
MGLVVTVFMAGLAGGAYWANCLPAGDARSTKRRLAGLAFAIAGLAALLPWGLQGLGRWTSLAIPSAMVPGVICSLTLVLAVLVGLEFPVACRLDAEVGSGTAARLYAADFAGACLGALLTSAWLVPVWGMGWTCAIVAALNLVGGVTLLFGKVKT